jgi:hypothetical protein
MKIRQEKNPRNKIGKKKENKDVGRIQAPKSKANKASEGADILTRELHVRAHYHASFILMSSRASAYCTRILHILLQRTSMDTKISDLKTFIWKIHPLENKK